MRCRVYRNVSLSMAFLLSGFVCGLAPAEDRVAEVAVPDLPDEAIRETYREAAVRNVLAAVNSQVFPGYFSVCADGQGFGFGNSYPSLDGHQMTDALLWLGQVDVAKKNWDYVKTFQRADGRLPLAILPALAGQQIGPAASPGSVAANGGLYQHWVPGDPLAALASPTYIQNADVIFRRTGDRDWLAAQMDSVNLAADFLASLMTPEGLVRGGGYYVERPTRLEADGVAQCYALDAFRRAAALNRVAGREADAAKFDALAARVERYFRTKFWAETHFAEYWHPAHDFIIRCVVQRARREGEDRTTETRHPQLRHNCACVRAGPARSSPTLLPQTSLGEKRERNPLPLWPVYGPSKTSRMASSFMY